MIRFSYKPTDRWPVLAWIARLVPGGNEVEVWHGPRVETCENWFCEAIWAGDFAAGDFDLTDRIFGSGARLRDGKMTFVSSASTCDRLHHAQVDGSSWISNSLPCLMNHIGATIDPTNDRYYHFFGSMTCGLKRYARDLATSAGPVRLTYFNNQQWDGQRLTEQEKSDSVTRFTSYEQYRGFLDDTLEQMKLNMASPDRTHAYRMLGTMSSGYDSSTVSTLAHAHGLRDAIAFTPSRNGWPDSGDAVAEAIGLDLKKFDRRAWDVPGAPEYLFISADAKGQDIFVHGARELLMGRALLTGYSGDGVWDRGLEQGTSNITGDTDRAAIVGEMIRIDRSGLSMTEYRLHAGYIHCPVPYLGARHRPEIYAISNSEAMKPWDIPGKYSRPIPRRILEGVGVARDAFGRYKRGSSVLFFEKAGLHSNEAVRDYQRWLSKQSRRFLRKRQVPPILLTRLLTPLQAVAKIGWSLNHRTSKWPGPLKLFSKLGRRMGEFSRKEFVSQYMFPWALQRAQEHYPKAPIDDVKTTPTPAPSSDA